MNKACLGGVAVAGLLLVGRVLAGPLFVDPWPQVFPGGVGGGYPHGPLLSIGNQLYGVAQRGGVSNWGTVFRVDVSGWNFTNLYTFSRSTGDPWGALTYCNQRLYGVTANGGVSGLGSIYSIALDGSGYLLHYSFANGPAGNYPSGSLITDGSTLYGATINGAVSNSGAIFSYWTGRTFPGISPLSVLHVCASNANDIACCLGSLALLGTNLYGEANYGGSYFDGALFRLSIYGGDFTLLHSFNSAAGDGFMAQGGLTLSGTRLFGVTSFGGTNFNGTLFAYDTAAPVDRRYHILHHFMHGTNDGVEPTQGVTVSGTNVYGTTFGGGSQSNGIVYRIGMDGTGFTLLTLPSMTNAGSLVFVPTIVGDHLYEVSPDGGATSNGLIFRVPLTVEPKLYFQNNAGQLVNWVLNATGGHARSSMMNDTGTWQLKAVGDVNGDGVADLLFQDSTTRYVAAWLMNADGTALASYCIGSAGGWNLMAAGDYLGAGNAQLFFQNPAGGLGYWRLNSDGTFNSAAALAPVSGWTLRGAGDLDGDGKAELFWQNSAGSIAIWFHNPDGSIRATIPFGPGAWMLSGVMDVDGDGVCDLQWQTADYLTGNWFMNTNGSSRAGTSLGITSGWRLKAAGR